MLDFDLLGWAAIVRDDAPSILCVCDVYGQKQVLAAGRQCCRFIQIRVLEYATLTATLSGRVDEQQDFLPVGVHSCGS